MEEINISSIKQRKCGDVIFPLKKEIAHFTVIGGSEAGVDLF